VSLSTVVVATGVALAIPVSLVSSLIVVAATFAALSGVAAGVLTGVTTTTTVPYVAIGFNTGPVDDPVDLRVDPGGGITFNGEGFLEAL